MVVEKTKHSQVIERILFNEVIINSVLRVHHKCYFLVQDNGWIKISEVLTLSFWKQKGSFAAE